MRLHLARIGYPVTALGPGRRVALWVAGCSLGCAGCISPELRPQAGGRPLAIGAVARRLLALPESLDGLTLTGGEPFQQPAALAALLAALRRRGSHWNVLAFSGYHRREILELGPEARRLLTAVDVLVAGRFRREVPAAAPLLASGNQRIHYLTSRGRSLRRAFELLPPDAADLALGGGEALLVGVLRPAARARLHARLRPSPAAVPEVGRPWVST